MVRTITRDEVSAKIDSGTAVVVEALPAAYYEAEHLPGALNLAARPGRPTRPAAPAGP